MIDGTIAGRIIVGLAPLLASKLVGCKVSLMLFSNDYFCLIGQSYSIGSPSESELFGSAVDLFYFRETSYLISL